ncbi:TerB family tellurite resistance protein [Algihabitans albus]|uniref:TerB family tellurite resistance protein n=1 Tax=Algihabitans albus TaxID=2164067 RepID=UPI000E5D3936|nr:TerB family tellurite resistance protein [Algihabitans albus]
MSIWGKIIGAGAGFAVGGPLGALIGGLAGHAVDVMRNQTAEQAEGQPPVDGTKSIAFTMGVIVLGAKMAKADGRVTPDEVAAFKEVFRVPADEMKNVGRIFNRARKDSGGFEPYARQLGGMFRENPAVLEELLDGLFHIARADGQVSTEEVSYLAAVSREFGLSETTWNRIREANMGPDQGDPYTILGVAHEAGEDEIKAAYRQLVRENHPDRLVAQGLPAEFVELANEKLATINQAYEKIRKARGF